MRFCFFNVLRRPGTLQRMQPSDLQAINITTLAMNGYLLRQPIDINTSTFRVWQDPCWQCETGSSNASWI